MVSLTINRKHPRRNAFCHSRLRFRAVPGLLAAIICCLSTPMVFGELGLPEIPKKRKKKEKNVVEIPPQAIPVEVEIRPGEETTIPLRVYGWRGPNVRYLLRSKPRQGEVTLIPGEKGVWALVYRHNGAIPPVDGATDRLLYAAQDSIGTSAPAEIRVTVRDFPPQFEMPHRATFGSIYTGESPSQTFTIANRGGGVVVGRIFVDAPWTVSPEEYILERGSEMKVKVTFAPTSEQEYQGRLTVSSESGMALQLSGMARDAFRVAPARLDLLTAEGELKRSGVYTLENRSKELQTLTVEADARLGLPEEIKLPAGETVELPVTLGENDLTAFKGSVSFSNGKIERSVELQAAPIGVRLFAEALEFGAVAGGSEQKVEKQLKVTNRGGTMASVAVTAPPTLSVNPLRFDLEPGAETELTVTLTASEEKELRETLRLQATGNLLEVPVSAEITLPQLANSRTIQRDGSPISEESDPTLASAPKSASPQDSLMRKSWMGDASVPTVSHVKARQIAKDTVEVSWEAPDKRMDLSYQPELIRMYFDIDGQPLSNWEALKAPLITREGQHLKLIIHGLAPGASGTIRIVSLTREGKRSVPSMTASYKITPRRPLITWYRASLLFFVSLGGVALWVKFGRIPVAFTRLIGRHGSE